MYANFILHRMSMELLNMYSKTFMLSFLCQGLTTIKMLLMALMVINNILPDELFSQDHS